MRKNQTRKTVMLLSIIGALGSGALFVATDPISAFATNPAGCGERFYVNGDGQRTPSPCGNWHNDPTPPKGATARCRDSTWSFSRHPYYWGTCSHHGGVESYL
jgi:hypothetical protein